MTSIAAVPAKNLNNPTIPYYQVKKGDREKIIQNLKMITGGDSKLITAEIAKTAIKSTIGSGGDIVGVPTVIDLLFGPALYIPIKGKKYPAFVTVKSLAQMMEKKL